MEQYLLYLKTYSSRLVKRLREATVRSRWEVTAVFFKFLVNNGYLLYDPVAAIERPIVTSRGERKPLTLCEVEALLSQPDLKKKTGLRDRAILEVLYSTGMRRGELLRLEIFDVDLNEKTLRIRKTKGLTEKRYYKERIVPLGGQAACYLGRYLREVRNVWSEKNPGVKALFLGRFGCPLSASKLYENLRRYTERSGIQRRVTPHILRHTCASHLLDGGADIFSIQQILGHEKAETTQVYAKSSVLHLAAIHRNCHPRDKMV